MSRNYYRGHRGGGYGGGYGYGGGGFNTFGYPFLGGFLGGLLGNVIYPQSYYPSRGGYPYQHIRINLILHTIVHTDIINVKSKSNEYVKRVRKRDHSDCDPF